MSYKSDLLPAGEMGVGVVTGYRGEEVPAVLVPLDMGSAMVRFHRPRKVVAPVQALVFYRGKR